jgi:hypothetical protein
MTEDGTLSNDERISQERKRGIFKRYNYTDPIVTITARHHNVDARQLQLVLNYIGDSLTTNIWDYFDSRGGENRAGFDLNRMIAAVQEIADKEGITLTRSWDDPNWR